MQHFSKNQVVTAGKTIKANHPHVTEELIAAYGLAHAWREAHLIPMRTVRRELSNKVKHWGVGAVTAGRLKRFQSIRRKLRRQPHTLYQIQDIGGCRAILASMQEVDRLVAAYRDGGSRFEVIVEDDYIQTPKVSGYRCNHIVVKFDGPEEQTGGNRLTVELQVRTRLQHAWATAVEAVGLVRNEDLKSGFGDPDWLRLFALMASEMAFEEGKPCVPGTPDSAKERMAELIRLDRKLEAVKTLESYNHAIRQSEDYKSITGNSFLIQYDIESKQVKISREKSFSRLSARAFDEEIVKEKPNTVVVEVDKVSDLLLAYPNYFLDVKMFTDRLRRSFSGMASSQGVSRYGLDWWFGGSNT